MRVLKNDFARYNISDEEDGDDIGKYSMLCSNYERKTCNILFIGYFFSDQDDYGWKIIHTDVFRFPPHKSLLCAILG